MAEETRRTAHSTLGLIRALQKILPDDVAEHVYYGATVQDLTDTWFALTMRDVGDLVDRDVRRLIGAVTDLAARHEGTVMPGRTHAQPGAPISFAFKLATWADELGRQLERVHEGRRRWATVQLGGAVGTLGFYGDVGPALRARFAQRLGLVDPGIAWFTSRDRIAEFAAVMTGISGTLARIGNEVMELQRPEIGELREAVAADVVGSIMMPHKRNPEASEHLDTLARLTRANAMVLLEGQVQLHERDGRPWKAEWVALPEVCLLTATSLRLAIACVDGLEVDAGRMRANVAAGQGLLASERILGTLSPRLGKHRAQAALQDILGTARHDGRSVVDALGCRRPDDPGRGRSRGRRPDRSRRHRRGAVRSRSRPGASVLTPPDRFPLAVLPTPLVRAPRLSAAVERDVWIKRDDLTGFALGGNKVRALEVLMADALDQRCDHVVGCGGPGSNLCSALAAAAATAGLACTLVLHGDEPTITHPNLALMRAFGARIGFTGDPDRASTPGHAAGAADRLRAAGCHPYVVPRGAASGLGATATRSRPGSSPPSSRSGRLMWSWRSVPGARSLGCSPVGGPSASLARSSEWP